MTKFKDYFSDTTFNTDLPDASVRSKLENSYLTLALKFNSKDIILDARYTGVSHPWLASLCEMLLGKSLEEASLINMKSWENRFKADQTFWDIRNEIESSVFHPALELLHGALDIFRGRDYLYHEESALVCRCFGIRESDILEHLKKNETPTLESLTGETKAGMGCRTCVPQLKRWVSLHEDKRSSRYFKDRAISEWMLMIDHELSRFPDAADWKMEVMGMKNSQVQISFEKEVSQREEEAMGLKLQGFLGRGLDSELTFFLSRARHLSKARG